MQEILEENASARLSKLRNFWNPQKIAWNSIVRFSIFLKRLPWFVIRYQAQLWAHRENNHHKFYSETYTDHNHSSFSRNRCDFYLNLVVHVTFLVRWGSVIGQIRIRAARFRWWWLRRRLLASLVVSSYGVMENCFAEDSTSKIIW